MTDESTRPSVVSRVTTTGTRVWDEYIVPHKRPILWGLGALVVIFIGFHILSPSTPAQGPGGRGGRFGNSGPMPVSTAVATNGDISVTKDALGTVTPLATITVRSQISGVLTQVAFQEGQDVNKGDLLAVVDPRPYQNALQQAQGQLERDKALLANAILDAERYKTLFEQNSIAKQQLDTQNALVIQDKGTVQIDEGQVATARLNLDYCYIKAPVSGRIGLRLVDPGNYVSVGDSTGVAVITQMQPMTVIFTVPEDSLPQILTKYRQKAPLTVTAFDRGLKTQLATGMVTTIDNQVDTTTGTVKLRAQFPNQDYALFPNQFVNVSLLIDTIHNATIVPTSAIQRGAPGTYVYLVTDAAPPSKKDGAEKTGWFGKKESSDAKDSGDASKADGKTGDRKHAGNYSGKTVTVRPVKLGVTSGERVQIVSGLQPADMVVTDGADKLKEGAPVSLSNQDQEQSTAKDSQGQDKSGGDAGSADQKSQDGQNGDGTHHRRHRRDGSDSTSPGGGASPPPADGGGPPAGGGPQP